MKNSPKICVLVLIIILIITAIIFVFYFKQSNLMPKTNIPVNLQPVQNNNEKNVNSINKQDLQNAPSKKNELTHYQSEKHGIEFDYYAYNDQNIIYEADNIIYVAHKTKQISCNKIDGCVEKNSKQYNFNHHKLTAYKKPPNESIEETINNLLIKEGKNLNNCKLTYVKNNNNTLVYLSIKNEYIPSESEIQQQAAQDGELTPYTVNFIKSKKITEICSNFAVDSENSGTNVFIFDNSLNKTEYFFGESFGMDALEIIPESIQFY